MVAEEERSPITLAFVINNQKAKLTGRIIVVHPFKDADFTCKFFSFTQSCHLRPRGRPIADTAITHQRVVPKLHRTGLDNETGTDCKLCNPVKGPFGKTLLGLITVSHLTTLQSKSKAKTEIQKRQWDNFTAVCGQCLKTRAKGHIKSDLFDSASFKLLQIMDSKQSIDPFTPEERETIDLPHKAAALFPVCLLPSKSTALRREDIDLKYGTVGSAERVMRAGRKPYRATGSSALRDNVIAVLANETRRH